MAKKIVLIGAGSASFTQGLVADLIVATDLGPWELGLVDVDPEALETAEGLSRRMVETREAEITVSASTDRRDLLPGADVVVMTVGVGGRRAWEADVFIPRDYGIYQPVGDTVMPGGVSRAMRMIPALVDIAADVAALCPEALFINYSNPMTANCQAIRRSTGLAVIGLCHGVFHVENQLAGFIDSPEGEVTSLFAGVNHLTFIFDFRRRGEDAWPVVRRKLAEERSRSEGETRENPFSWSIFESYGAYPAVNDRHVVEFFPERFPGGSYYGKTLGVDAFSFEDTIARGDQNYADMRARAAGEKPLDEAVFNRSAGEHEQLVGILSSIEGDTRILYSANLPNRGAIPALPPEAVLELPAVATAGGLRPIQLPDFPAPLAAIISRRAAATSLTVEAALAGDRRLLVEALLADGAVSDPTVAGKLGDDLLEAHREHLPNFYDLPS